MFIAKDEISGYVLHNSNNFQAVLIGSLGYTTGNQDNSSYLREGNQFHSKKNFQSALSCYDKIIYDANYYYAIFAKALSLRKLGFSLRKSGYYVQALDWYNIALKINSNDIFVLRGKALTLHYLGCDTEAILWYDRALEIDPNNVESLSNKAKSLMELKRYEEANNIIEKGC